MIHGYDRGTKMQWHSGTRGASNSRGHPYINLLAIWTTRLALARQVGSPRPHPRLRQRYRVRVCESLLRSRDSRLSQVLFCWQVVCHVSWASIFLWSASLRFCIVHSAGLIPGRTWSSVAVPAVDALSLQRQYRLAHTHASLRTVRLIRTRCSRYDTPLRHWRVNSGQPASGPVIGSTRRMDPSPSTSVT